MCCNNCTPHKNKPDFEQPQLKVQTQKPFQRAAKVIMIGNSTVGKSSLCHHCRGAPLVHQHNATVAPAYHELPVTTPEGKQVKLKLWDTAGQEKFKSINRIFYRGADIAIVVFDVTSPASFEDVDFWVGELQSMVE